MIMTWYTAVFLGLVQGLAEFLPISSSGHLLLFESWFGIHEGSLLLTILLHLATLLAVVVVYHRQLYQLIRHPWNVTTVRLILATALTCGLVLVFHDVIDGLFTVTALPYAFLIAGVYLLIPTFYHPKRAWNPWWQVVAVGLAQGVAVVPGLSRSGLTITTGRIAGMTPTNATDFSFIMSIPIILGSLVYELLRGGSVQSLGVGNLILAFVSAFIAGIIAIKVMLDLTKKIDLRWFAVYLLLLGGGLLLISWFN